MAASLNLITTSALKPRLSDIHVIVGGEEPFGSKSIEYFQSSSYLIHIIYDMLFCISQLQVRRWEANYDRMVTLDTLSSVLVMSPKPHRC